MTKRNYSKIFITATALALPGYLSAQCTPSSENISTIAGNHTKGYSGDGGAGTAAQIGSPYAVASDAAGNVYIADYFNHAVRRVSTSGVITTVAGTGVAGFSGDGGDATLAKLNGPAGVTVDPEGNLYIADKFNERIRKVDAVTGTITTLVGDGYHGGWQGHGFGNDGPATAASLTYPVSVALDCSGNMYIVDQGSQTVRKVTPGGIISRFAGTHKGSFNGDGQMATASHLNHPTGIAVDCSGNVFISDTWNNRIRKVDNMGIMTTVAGNGAAAYAGDGGPATAASIFGPWGVTLDVCGNLYISDYDNYVVRKVTAGGTISTFAGTHSRGYTGDGGLASAAKVYLPSSVAIDGASNIYIADYGNLVVRMVGTSGVAPRAFAGGTTQELHACGGTPVAVSDLLSVADAPGLDESWTIGNMPLHGTLTEPTGAAAKNGMVTPSGLVYTPEAGFAGVDEFTILMADGATGAATTITVTVDELPDAGVITQGSVMGNVMSLSSSGMPGGVWTSSDSRIATVDDNGNVTAVTNGVATIAYTVTNKCGEKKASSNIVSQVSEIPAGKAMVFPNPNKGSFRYDFMSAADEPVELVARDVTGKIIYRETVNAVKGINTLSITLPASIQRPSVIWLSAGSSKTTLDATAVMLSE